MSYSPGRWDKAAVDADVTAILGRRHDNGADFWATPDRKIYVGNPFSTIGALVLLHELGVKPSHEAVRGSVGLLLDACHDDGRIHVGPKSPRYPCYTAEAARVLGRFGFAKNPKVRRVAAYLLDSTHETGGWRCAFTKFGSGPETRCANPGATVYALDALRFFPEYRRGTKPIDRAIESLLEHWTVRKPIGPCHHGIGTAFMQVEYPFLRYNLFYYVYVLSFYPRAVSDRRFREALGVLSGKLSADGQMIVEAPHRSLKGLALCARGKPSVPATKRYRELLANTE